MPAQGGHPAAINEKNNIIMEFLSALLAIFALGFSLYTFFAHDRRLKKQENLLNEYQLRSLAQSEEENKKAIIRAKAVKYNSGNRTLYIYNTGKAKARNLKVEMPNDKQVFASRPVFPLNYDELLPDASREVTLFLTEGDNVLTLTFEWEDDYSKDNKEQQTIDL